MTTPADRDVNDIGDLADHVISFPDGLPSFPDHKRFLLVNLLEDGVFQELRGVEDDSVSMLVCVPWLFFPDYAPDLSEAEQEQLEIRNQEDAVVFCPVTFDTERREVSLNLLGPFVVNTATRIGQQLVLAGSEYPVRAAITLPVS